MVLKCNSVPQIIRECELVLKGSLESAKKSLGNGMIYQLCCGEWLYIDFNLTINHGSLYQGVSGP